MPSQINPGLIFFLSHIYTYNLSIGYLTYLSISSFKIYLRLAAQLKAVFYDIEVALITAVFFRHRCDRETQNEIVVKYNLLFISFAVSETNCCSYD